MNYREDLKISQPNREKYLSGLENLINTRRERAEKIRFEYAKTVFDTPEKHRDDLKRLMGWPLADYEDSTIPNAKHRELSKEEGYTVFRTEIEILDGLWLSGLLFKKNSDAKKPMVIVQHGGMGTPELISGVLGDTANYNNMLERVIRHDVNAFAPQLLLWDREKISPSFDRAEIDARLKFVGSSIFAVEIYGIKRIIDYFESLDYVGNFGMVGLSYGGFYTMYTAAIDTRIKSAFSCSFFNNRDNIYWSNLSWFGAAEKFDDAEVACLVYPRRLLIEIGSKDPLFNPEYGIESYKKIEKLCEKVGTDWIDFRVFDGIHEFDRDDDGIIDMIKYLSE